MKIHGAAGISLSFKIKQIAHKEMESIQYEWTVE